MIPEPLEKSLESLLSGLDGHEIEVCVIEPLDLARVTEEVLQRGGTLLTCKRYGKDHLFAFTYAHIRKHDYPTVRWLIDRVEGICLQVTKKYDQEIGELFKIERNRVMADR